MIWSTCTSKPLAQTRASPSESIETRDHSAASGGKQYTADSDDRSASYRFPSLASIDTLHEPGWRPSGSAEWCDPRNLLPALPGIRRRHTQRPRLERLDPIADLRRALELELLRGLAHLLAQRGHPLRQLGRRQRRELVLLLGGRHGQVVGLAHRGQRLG